MLNAGQNLERSFTIYAAPGRYRIDLTVLRIVNGSQVTLSTREFELRP